MERSKQIKVCDFTQKEIEVFLQRSNFTPDEETLFFTKKQRLYIRTSCRKNECEQ